jgi:hypothetical protein
MSGLVIVLQKDALDKRVDVASLFRKASAVSKKLGIPEIEEWIQKELAGYKDDDYHPDIERLRPEDLPSGVTAKKSYDQRGHCYAFEHESIGDLGKVVLINLVDKPYI